MRTKLQILTQAVVLLMMILAQLIIMDQYERSMHSAAEEKSLSMADGVINGANMLMLTGAITNESLRQAFVNKMQMTEGIDSLRILRGEPVRSQYGDGFGQTRPQDEVERAVLDDGLARFETYKNQDGVLMMEAVVPFIASENFRGTNCLQCHTAAESGDILGAASMTVDLADKQKQLSQINIGLWVGQIVFQIILFIVISVIARRVTAPATRLSELMGRIQETGDLRIRSEVSSRDEIGRTALAFNQLMDHLQRFLGRLNAGIQELEAAARVMAGSAETVKTDTRRQSEMAISIAAATEQIRSTIGGIADGTRDTASDVEEASRQAVAGEQVVDDAADEMTQVADAVDQAAAVIQTLGERSQTISGIVTTISQIAEQTNLLALNAAIEAARAGDQGRGFAVVAEEVRSLAQRTAAATEEITGMTRMIQNETTDAVEKMASVVEQAHKGASLGEEAAKALATIRDGAQRTVERVSGISAGIDEQAAASEEISRTMQAIRDTAEDMDRAMEDTGAEVERLKRLADELRREADGFQA
ncbi:MAG: methyl-accepting chemotaxis protein [Halothiobacillaceae bacterium]